MPLSFAEALQRAQTLPMRFTLFYHTLRTFSSIANFVLRIAGILLAIYLVHQLFFWLSGDPEAAFDRGRFVVEVIELIWDLWTLLWNVAADVINSAILPLWNAAAFYIFEPAIVLVLEVFSLVFLRKKYEGFVNENDFAFGGFVCDSSSQVSETWCGRFGAYNKRLEVSGSETAENSITFGVATARRLSELAGDAELDVPSVDTEELIGALDGLSTQAIVMGASAFDVLFAVLYEIFETTATFIFDAVWIILRTVFDILKLLIKSGLLQTIIGIGLDFILVVALEIGVPMIIAGVDFLVCILQLFLWETWAAQLECVEGNDARAPRRGRADTLTPLAPTPRAQPSASRAPTPRPTCGCSPRSPWRSSASPPCWRPRSTRAPARPSPAAGRSTSSASCPRSSPRSAAARARRA
jgi:hypothetical protein